MEISKKLNIIGDVHGNPVALDLIMDDAINVFVGDYLDAKRENYQTGQEINFLEILRYKQENPDKVNLLLANHDMPYFFLGRYGYVAANSKAFHYYEMFQTHKHLFDGVAYGKGKYLITHAGVSKVWYEKYFGEYKGETAEELAQKLNDLFWEDPNAYTFGEQHYYVTDIYGDDEHQSPVWIRPRALKEYNLLENTDIVQIVGHTPKQKIENFNNKIIFIDCLLYSAESYVVEVK